MARPERVRFPPAGPLFLTQPRGARRYCLLPRQECGRLRQPQSSGNRCLVLSRFMLHLCGLFALATLFLHLLSGFLGICFVFVLFEVTELIYFFISPQLGQSLTPRHQPGVY